MLRQLNPARLERTLISPLNPWLSWLKPAAEYVRAHRQPVSADNPLWQLQEQWSGWMEQGLNHYRDLRDAATEHCFKAVYESPWLASVVGVQPARETRAARCDSWDKQERLQLKRQVLDPAYESGTLADGFVRLLIYVAIGRGIIDERPFNAIRRIMRDIRHEYPMTLMQLKDIARKQVFLVRLDEARALAGLPKLLPQEHLRRQAWQLARELLALSGDIVPEQQQRLDQVAHMLQLDVHAPAPAILPPAEPLWQQPRPLRPLPPLPRPARPPRKPPRHARRPSKRQPNPRPRPTPPPNPLRRPSPRSAKPQLASPPRSKPPKRPPPKPRPHANPPPATAPANPKHRATEHRQCPNARTVNAVWAFFIPMAHCNIFAAAHRYSR